MTRIRLARIAAAFCMTALTGWGGALIAAEAPHETSYRTADGLVVIPASSQARPEDAGIRAHTNTRLFFRDFIHNRSTNPPTNAETPASLACVYGFVTPVTGCAIASVTAVPTGGSKLVVIVDAYDDPTATNDLTVYSKQFGLPAVTNNNFAVAYATGTKPPQDSTGGWELEESLDIEMAHAMAPGAKVVLMEAASSNNSDLFAAVAAAQTLVAAAGGGEVSMSWGESEFNGETSYESYFDGGANVVFFASTGDSPGTIFPSVLQNVVGAGGTTINRSGGKYTTQSAWNDGGGGSSSYVKIPSYQSAIKKIKKIVGKYRGVPDFSFDANPGSGVAVYDTTKYNGGVLDWIAVGGTSVASPALAAIVNSAGSFAASTSAELTAVYDSYTKTADWTDVALGTCGNNGGAKATKGYDFCTGIGVPNGYGGK
jgi:subtilase family serine protease